MDTIGTSARRPNGRRHGPRLATGSEVAALAGVSKSSVSRAFTGGVVSDEARARILTAAAELKYRPNHTARTLTTNRSRLIGVAVTHLDNQFYPEVVEALSDRLAARGYRIILFITKGARDLDPMLNEILGHRVDGVVFASSSLSAEVALECIAANIPAVMFNSTDPSGRVKSVSAANSEGAATVASFLIAAGHRRLAVISGLEESTTSVERCKAFVDWAVASGLAAPAVESGRYTFDGAIEATRRLLSRQSPPDSIFCVNDHMALAALQVARGEFGLDVGREISIVGFDGVDIAAWPAFSLTSYSQPVAVMICRIVDYLATVLDGGKIKGGHERLPGELIVRNSARIPAGAITLASGEKIWRNTN